MAHFYGFKINRKAYAWNKFENGQGKWPVWIIV